MGANSESRQSVDLAHNPLQPKRDPAPDPELDTFRAQPLENSSWESLEARPLQRKKSAASPEASPLPPPTGGGALPDPVKAKMERSFGADFSDVRVHQDGNAERVGALAYTRGSDLHFQRGSFDPGSERGQELIGHELTHVVQQREGRVAVPQGKGLPINDDGGLEAEADRQGALAAKGLPASGAAVGTAPDGPADAPPTGSHPAGTASGSWSAGSHPAGTASGSGAAAVQRKVSSGAASSNVIQMVKGKEPRKDPELTFKPKTTKPEDLSMYKSSKANTKKASPGAKKAAGGNKTNATGNKTSLTGNKTSLTARKPGTVADKKTSITSKKTDTVADKKTSNTSKKTDSATDNKTSVTSNKTDLVADNKTGVTDKKTDSIPEKTDLVADNKTGVTDKKTDSIPEKTDLVADNKTGVTDKKTDSIPEKTDNIPEKKETVSEKKDNISDNKEKTPEKPHQKDSELEGKEKEKEKEEKEKEKEEEEEEEGLEVNLKLADAGSALEAMKIANHELAKHEFSTKEEEEEAEKDKLIEQDPKAKIGLFEAQASATALKGRYENDYVQAEGRLLSAEGKAEAGIEMNAEEVALKLGLTGNLTIAAGRIILKPPPLEIDVLGEKIFAEAGVQLDAAVIASARMELAAKAGGAKKKEGGKEADGDKEKAPAASGVNLKKEGNGVKVDFEGGLDAFCGVKGGASIFGKLQWQPKAFSKGPPIPLGDDGRMDVLGASFGAEGWAGAAAACQVKASLLPSLKFSSNIGVGIGVGGSLKLEIELNLVSGAMLAFTLAARGMAAMFDAVGMEHVAKVIDCFVTSLYEDDVARLMVSKGLHKGLLVPQRALLINQMLDGFCGDEDEAAIVTIFRDANAGDASAILLGIPNGVNRLYKKVDGAELAELFAVLFSKKIEGLPMTDDIARAIVQYGAHKGVSPTDAAKMINAMLKGWTGNADEQAIIKLLADQDNGAINTILGQIPGNFQGLCGSFSGDNLDTLKALFKMKGVAGPGADGKEDAPLVNEKLTDDGARGLTNLAPDVIGTDPVKVGEAIDAMLEGLTGDDDELAILTLLGRLEKDGFETVVRPPRLARLKKQIDGAEYAQFKALILKHGLDDMLKKDEIDDATIRAWVALGGAEPEGGKEAAGDGKDSSASKKEPTEEEKAAAKKQSDRKDQMLKRLLQGVTGDEDELAILSLLGSASDDEFARLVADNKEALKKSVDGEEYDKLLALLFKRKKLETPFALNDNAARLIVADKLHEGRSADDVFSLITALLDGRVGDDDEKALLEILKANEGMLPDIVTKHGKELSSAIDGENHIQYMQLLYKHGLAKDSDMGSHLAAAIAREEDEKRKNAPQKSDKEKTPEELEKEKQAASGSQKVKLIRDMLSGFTRGDKEDGILSLLEGATKSEWDELASNPGPERFHKQLDGDNNDRFHALLVRRGWGTPKLSDNVARIVAGSPELATLSTDMMGWLVDQLLSGVTGDDDEAALLKILEAAAKTGWATVVTPERAKKMKKAVDGEEYQKLLKLFVQHGDPSGDELDDDLARASVEKEVQRLKAEQEKAKASSDGQKDGQKDGTDGAGKDGEKGKGAQPKPVDVSTRVKLIQAMLEGFTGDADEQAIITLLEASSHAETAKIVEEVGLKKLEKAIDGEEYDQFMALLFEKEVPNLVLGDDAARTVLKRGKVEIASLPVERAAILIDAMLKGATGDDDEKAILEILKAHLGNLAALCAKVKGGLPAIKKAIDGRESKELLGLLWVEGKLDKGVTLDDGIACGLVRQGLHKGLSDGQAQAVIAALEDGYVSGEDEEAIIAVVNEADLKLEPTRVGVLANRITGDNRTSFFVATARRGFFTDVQAMPCFTRDALRAILNETAEKTLNVEFMLRFIGSAFKGAESAHLVSVIFERHADQVLASPKEMRQQLGNKMKPFVSNDLYGKFTA